MLLSVVFQNDSLLIIFILYNTCLNNISSTFLRIFWFLKYVIILLLVKNRGNIVKNRGNIVENRGNIVKNHFEFLFCSDNKALLTKQTLLIFFKKPNGTSIKIVLIFKHPSLK